MSPVALRLTRANLSTSFPPAASAGLDMSPVLTCQYFINHAVKINARQPCVPVIDTHGTGGRICLLHSPGYPYLQDQPGQARR